MALLLTFNILGPWPSALGPHTKVNTMENIYHSVRLDDEKCQGCTNCIKRCPTQAIRVRGKKAYIISDRCIDCGECIRVCPHHAKYAVSGHFNEILKYMC